MRERAEANRRKVARRVFDIGIARSVHYVNEFVPRVADISRKEHLKATARLTSSNPLLQ